jgi:hypothetical protein
MAKNRRKDALVWGIILIIIGLIFFLENYDINVWDSVARLWPVVLIVWGAWKLYYGLKERKEETRPVKPNQE